MITLHLTEKGSGPSANPKKGIANPGVGTGHGRDENYDPIAELSKAAAKYGFEPTDRKDTFRRTVEETDQYGPKKTRMTVIYWANKFTAKSHLDYITSFGPNSTGFELGSFDTPEEAFNAFPKKDVGK